MNDPSPNEIKHTWPAITCVIVGRHTFTGIHEKGLGKNRLVKVHVLKGNT